MKGYAIALAILLLLVAAVAWNSVYVQRVANILLDDLRALPSVPVSNQAETTRAIRSKFDRQTPLLGVTVSGSTLDRIRESLCLLELYAASEDVSRYTATLVLLREQIEAIARPEKLSVDNLF